MVRTKQTARKNSSGKPLAMGRTKPQANPTPKPGGRVDRKVIIEFSSDESFDEDRPQPVEGSGAPKRVMKRIHLTLPTSPCHVTTTETITTFFINHGFTKAVRKAFEKQGWSTDDIQELITNFQRKHGKKVPLPKIYMDEDSSDSEGLELEDETRVGRKATGGSGGSTGGQPGRKPSVGGSGGSGGSSGGSSSGPSMGGGGAGGLGGSVVAQAGASSVARMMTTPMMTPTRKGRQAILPRHQGNHWPGKNLERASLHMVDSTSVQG